MSETRALGKELLREEYALPDRSKTRVRVNFISSADGAVTLAKSSGGLGSKTDQELMKVLRAMADVVVVGAGTVRAEGYGGLGLKEADIKWRRSQGLSDHPRIAVVTNRGDLDPEMSVFTKADVRPIVVTNETAKIDSLRPVADIITAGHDSVSVATLNQELAMIGLNQILCEGGPHLFGAYLDADLVDEVCLTLAPTFVGGNAGRISHSIIEAKRNFELVNLLREDSMLFLRYAFQRSG